jgi:UDP-2,3-diacylglucosamine pyrophosphatase LpxH
MGKTKYRTVWISDIHLGTRGCKHEALCEFLDSIECEVLYLVGDIFDLWKLRSGWYWPQGHNRVVKKLFKMSKRGVKVIFIPGNHDEYFRDFLGINFGDIEVIGHAVHETIDGRKLLVIHGDQFDALITKHKWIGILGSHAYDWLLSINTVVAWGRKKMGLKYWSLSKYIKHKAKAASNAINNFEMLVAEAAKRKGMDGVVCGHIHKAEIREIDGITYYNDGDWVESCTALVEHFDGRMEIIEWNPS